MIGSGNTSLLLVLMLNHFRLFILGKLRYWGDRDFYSEIRLWNTLIGLITVDTAWIAYYGLEYPEAMDKLVELVKLELDVDKPKVLEVGSGPISRLRDGTHKFELYCLDPLAKEYIRLLKIKKMKTDIKFIQGTCEKISQIFEKEQFIWFMQVTLSITPKILTYV